MKNYIYQLEFKVRDYECDLQGIVNNSVYQNYYEHSRHEFLLARGVSFDYLHQIGVDAVVARVEIAYKNSLKSGDTFLSRLDVVKQGPKYIFEQMIIRESDNAICSTAKITTVVKQNGKLLSHYPKFDELVSKEI